MSFTDTNVFTTGRKVLYAVALIAICAVAAFSTSSASAASRCVNSVYAEGSRGTCVKYIQTMVNYDVNQHLSVDGIFGAKTRAGIVTEQRVFRNLFSPAASIDGIVGPQTWKRLCTPEKGPAPTAFVNAARNAGCPGY